MKVARFASFAFLVCSCAALRPAPELRPYPEVRPLDLQSDPVVRRRGDVLWAERRGLKVEVTYIQPAHLDSLMHEIPGGKELLGSLRRTEGREQGWWLAFRMVFVNDTGRRIYFDPGAFFLVDLRYITRYRAFSYREISALFYPRSGSAFGVERYRRLLKAASGMLLRKGFVESGKGRGGIVLFRFRGDEEREVALVLSGIDLSPDDEEVRTADFRFDFSYAFRYLSR
ncbi:MAG TPA: hypothetical protein EYP61_06075 [Candidatus Latescibacteria bacterium]|nr:hypothetical protein [Candidatus Latescibacterota bacterium]